MNLINNINFIFSTSRNQINFIPKFPNLINSIIRSCINLNNIMNMATLAANIQTLKGQSDKSAFYRDFATGLVAGSGQLVTDKISNSVMNGLTNLVNKVDLSKVQDAAATAQQKGTAAVENATVIANSVTNILNLFKK